MLRSSLALALASGFVFAACHGDAKESKQPPASTPVTAGTVGADGVRRIAVEVNKEGYKPERIGGKPGEKLTLVFTRTAESTCIAQLKAPDGKLVDLPMNQPVEIAVAVPQTGEVGFACGMDMFHGVVVAEKS